MSKAWTSLERDESCTKAREMGRVKVTVVSEMRKGLQSIRKGNLELPGGVSAFSQILKHDHTQTRVTLGRRVLSNGVVVLILSFGWYLGNCDIIFLPFVHFSDSISLLYNSHHFIFLPTLLHSPVPFTNGKTELLSCIFSVLFLLSSTVS